jgi:hypothetical protein
MTTLTHTFFTTQQKLFPALECELKQPLGRRLELFVMVAELIDPAPYLGSMEWQGRGRPSHWRLPMVLAFIAKAVLNVPTTRALLDRLAHDPTLRRLCGWERSGEVPSEPTFSRVFELFARAQLPQRLHEAMVRMHWADKLAGHVSRDSTAIEARERASRKPPRVKYRRGRPRRGEVRSPRHSRRLLLQPTRTLEENLADLPTGCDSGAKKNSKGQLEFWRGYKLHLDVIDGQIPVSAILTSASTHDSQVAIALAQMTARRATNLYDLMDAGYDAREIRDFSRRLGHVPLIDPSDRKGGGPPLDPAQTQRYKERTTVERVNSDLKDNHGGRHVRVRGALKVMAHLMWGLLVVTAKGLCRLLE